MTCDRSVFFSGYSGITEILLIVAFNTIIPRECLTLVTRRLSIVEQESINLLEHLISFTVFSWVRVVQSVVFCIVFCGLLFFVSLFFRPLYRLSFDLQLLITALELFQTSIMMSGYFTRIDRVVIPVLISIKAYSINFIYILSEY